VDWGPLGGPFTVVPKGTVVPVTGLPGGFSGNFAPGEKLLFGAPDLVLLFNSPISGVGMQIQPPSFNVAFTAQISMVRLDACAPDIRYAGGQRDRQAWSTSSWSWLKGHRDI